jgi:hypothetical protein
MNERKKERKKERRKERKRERKKQTDKVKGDTDVLLLCTEPSI